MLRLLRKNWWKILSVVLILFSVLAGLAVPLGPGIYSASPFMADAGQRVEMQVTGYNTHFDEGKSSLKFWLYYHAKTPIRICAESMEVTGPQTAKVVFNIPTALPLEEKVLEMDLQSNNDIDGTVGLQSALAVTKKDQGNTYPDCKIEVNTNSATHFNYPFKSLLKETIRNLFFHVPMWFAMIVLFTVSVVYSIRYLNDSDELNDIISSQFIYAGLLFATCGLLTGMVWAKFAWGQFWVFTDVKLLGAAILCLEYFAYAILRGSIQDEQSRAKVSAVYNIFAAASIAPLIFILPRMNGGTLHPGNGGNPGFNSYDLDNHMRLVFYPAVLGWTLMGVWIAQLRVRIKKVENAIYENQ